MSEQNRKIVEEVNRAFTEGKMENVFAHFADGVVWNMVGDRTVTGKDNIREWMSSMGAGDMEPPKFTVDKILTDETSAACYGDMTMKGEDGVENAYSFCDVYEFKDGKIIELRAFVVKQKAEDERSETAAG